MAIDGAIGKVVAGITMTGSQRGSTNVACKARRFDTLTSRPAVVPLLGISMADQAVDAEHDGKDVAHDHLSDGVHVGCAYSGLDDPSPHAAGDTIERGPELVVAVTQQDLRRFSVHGCISQLLGRPGLGRISTGLCLPRMAVQESGCAQAASWLDKRSR
jgi:hypothetical protein